MPKARPTLTTISAGASPSSKAPSSCEHEPSGQKCGKHRAETLRKTHCALATRRHSAGTSHGHRSILIKIDRKRETAPPQQQQQRKLP